MKDPRDALREAVRTIPDFPEPGIQFKDITPIFADPALLKVAVEHLAAPFEGAGITRVVGIEARGFILGSMVARHLGAGFVPVRKAGKLPYRTLRETYDLEYGTDTIEMHIDALGPGDRVLIHDDVIATGGTAAATARLVRRAGGLVAGYTFLVELSFLEGRARLDDGAPIHAVLPY
ncbi:MAG: adenine phosphoribosyltransferase [Rhodothermaceae bacterium]|nr:MAG: adenine phosphoribosyltransferase [Rhodothermaceae bacterium]